jgi:hypothetical protein
VLETFIIAAIGGAVGSLMVPLCWDAIERGTWIASREYMLWRIQRAAQQERERGQG